MNTLIKLSILTEIVPQQKKYSYRATLEEIATNDYNLNIPRYVDTFEEEEAIDIEAVMREIKQLEAKRSELDKEIDVYFKELGLVFENL